MGILSKLIMGDLLAGVKDVVEAEGRQLRHGAMQFLVGVELLVVGLVVLLAAVGFILWGLYALLAPSVGQWGSAFIVGGLCLLIGLVLTLYARRMAK